MLYVAVDWLLEDVERADNFKGRKWYKPSSWRTPTLPKGRICSEVYSRLQKMDQPYFGITQVLCNIFTEDLGYSRGGYPLQDTSKSEDFWNASTENGRARRKLLKELHAHLKSLEFGTTPPTDD